MIFDPFYKKICKLKNVFHILDADSTFNIYSLIFSFFFNFLTHTHTLVETGGKLPQNFFFNLKRHWLNVVKFSLQIKII